MTAIPPSRQDPSTDAFAAGAERAARLRLALDLLAVLLIFVGAAVVNYAAWSVSTPVGLATTGATAIACGYLMGRDDE